MSKKNIFLLAAWYVAGWLIASIYNKKKPEELKKELENSNESWDWKFKIMVDSFVETHSALVDDLKKELMTEKNIKIFNDHKEEVFNILDSYKEKWNILIDELKKEGKTYIITASEKLEELYKEKTSEIEKIQWITPEKIEWFKEKLLASFEELKKEIKKIKK